MRHLGEPHPGLAWPLWPVTQSRALINGRPSLVRLRVSRLDCTVQYAESLFAPFVDLFVPISMQWPQSIAASSAVVLHPVLAVFHTIVHLGSRDSGWINTHLLLRAVLLSN